MQTENLIMMQAAHDDHQYVITDRISGLPVISFEFSRIVPSTGEQRFKVLKELFECFDEGKPAMDAIDEIFDCVGRN